VISKGFLSQVTKYEKLSLGETQKIFLYIIAEKPISAYDIHLHIKKEIDIKNVRKTVSRLHDLGLIEVEGYYPRNAIRFRLTSHGLFQLLCDGPIPASILDMYKNDVIIQTILFEYFEEQTIVEWMNLEAPGLLAMYVHKCCQAILTSLQDLKSMTKEYGRIKEFERNKAKHLESFLNISLDSEIGKFLLQIIAGRLTEEHFIPKIALGRDKKFIALAKEMKKNFEDGCKDFMI